MSLEKIEEIAKRRGFFWKSSEIYGGLSGFYDYGHLGASVKRKWEEMWREFFLGMDENFVEIGPTNIMHEQVFVGSGHVKCFVDPVTKCRKCGHTERADHILENVLEESFEGITPEKLEGLIKEHKIKCEKCGGKMEEVGVFNMLFPLEVGAENSQKAYLRGETAQGAYVNFPRVFEQMRRQLPLGIAVIGRAYRNEISPRNLLVRMREFTQAELQIFFDSETIDDQNIEGMENYKIITASGDGIRKITCRQLAKDLPKMYVYYLAKVQEFYLESVKFPEGAFRVRELSDEEKAFYNKHHWDVELKIDGKWKECGGVHYRTDHDLAGHQKTAKKSMEVSVNGKKLVPHVLELSFGVDRNILALLENSYKEEKKREVVRFPRKLAPFDCAVFPLVSKDGLPEKAKEVKQELENIKFSVFYDYSGSIGRRYRRMDEIGVPASVTVDYDTMEDGTVTIRDRDSMDQIRAPLDEIGKKLYEFLSGKNLKDLE